MFFLCQVIPKNFKRANFKLEFNLMICGFTKNSHIKGGGGGGGGGHEKLIIYCLKGRSLDSFQI